MAPIVKEKKIKRKKMALRSGHLSYKKEDSPNIKFINENFPNIGLTIKKYDVNLMQFFIIDNDNNPVKRIPENINCFVYEKTKKIEKKKKNIEEIESWITSWADDFVFEINGKAFFWLQTIKSHAMCHTKGWKKVKITEDENEEISTMEISDSEN